MSDPNNSAPAVEAVTMAQVHEAINGAVKRIVTTDLPKALEPFGASFAELRALMTPKEAPAPPAPATGKSEGTGSDPAANAQLLQLSKQIDEMKKSQAASDAARDAALAKAKSTEKASTIRAALNGMNFVSPDANQDAFDLLNSLVDFDENDNLVSKEGNLPVAAFVADFIPSKKSYLLAPARANGSGATSGRFSAGGKAVGLETISANMTPEESIAVGQAMRAAALELQGK